MYRVGVMVINDAGDSDILEAVWDCWRLQLSLRGDDKAFNKRQKWKFPLREPSLFVVLSCQCL
jgi:hypothetical protein